MNGKGNRKKFLVFGVLSSFFAAVVMIVMLFTMAAYVAQPVEIVVDAIASFFSMHFPDEQQSIEDTLVIWKVEDGADLENAYYAGCTSFSLAESVSFYYYYETGTSIVPDNNWLAYLNCFCTSDTETIFQLLQNQYGYAPDEETRENINGLAAEITKANPDRTGNFDMNNLGYDGATGYTALENTVILTDNPLNDAIWNDAYKIGGGNPFYYAALQGGWSPKQCTVFAWYRFYQVYGYPSGAHGSGRYNASEVVSAHSDKFILSNSPAPGAIVSMPGTNLNPSGHVAFVEKVEGDTLWYSEGNYCNGGIRLNMKESIAAFTYSYCGGSACLVYAVPIK